MVEREEGGRWESERREREKGGREGGRERREGGREGEREGRGRRGGEVVERFVHPNKHAWAHSQSPKRKLMEREIFTRPSFLSTGPALPPLWPASR